MRKVDSKRNFNDILSTILAFIKQENPLIPPLVFPFTLQRLVSDALPLRAEMLKFLMISRFHHVVRNILRIAE